MTVDAHVTNGLASSYFEAINLEPQLGQVRLAHGVPRVCVCEYPQVGHLQLEGPPIPCLGPPLPLPYPRLTIPPIFSS